MGLLLSILFSYVGAVELMFIVRDIVHQVGLHHERMKINRSPSKATSLLDLQNDLRKSIKSAQEHLCETDSIHSMADGVLYDQGYRILSDDEQNIAKNWLEARANVTIEPLHSIKLNIKDNYGAEAVTNSCNQYEELVSQDDSLRSSSLSLDTIIENQKNSFQIENNHLSDNSDKNEMLNIHFDEYSQDYSYPSDEITKKGQRKNEDARRRKSYKMFTVGHSGADILQRRRSEDVDGETQNPWGELNPKSFHDDSLWRRERTMSIDENEESVGFVNGKSNENFKHAPETCNNISSNSKNIIETMIVHGLNKSDVSKTIETIPNLPQIFIEDEAHVMINDDEINDCIAANERYYDEYLEQSTRLRYPSRNYDDDDDDELKEFSLVEHNEYDLKDLANDFKLNHSRTEQSINNRKPNMFALASPKHLDDDKNKNQNTYKPVIRITPTEDERIEKFLYENCVQNDDSTCNCAETLIKSKTTMFYCGTDDSMGDLNSFESNSRPQSPSSLNANGRDSLLSETSSDPINFECKESTIPSFFDNREDSCSSKKSNILYERSQSRFSELEYIKGRDDWKDSYLRYDISEEIDSDNYHHLRRHSEAADTLEYIVGREDALRNSLPQIFEINESEYVIQDEIDSDEYHHNLFRNYLHTKSTVQEIETQNDNINIDNYGKQFFGNSHITDDKHNNIKKIALCTEASIDKPINIIFNGRNEITDVITSHEMENSEDLEITILDCMSHDDDVTVQQDNTNNPFIVISEATDESSEILIEQVLNHTQEPTDIAPLGINENNLISIQKGSVSEIANEMIIRQEETTIDLVQSTDVVEEKSAKQGVMNLLNTNEQKPKRNLSFENVEDLIRDVSSGPWFHN